MDCRSVLAVEWEVRYKRIWREANGRADLLAKEGVSHTEMQIFYGTCPMFLLQCLYWDSMGFNAFRFAPLL